MVAFVGLLIGVILGIVWNVDIPVKFSPYISVAIFACLDSVFGALRGSISHNFREDIFISGFWGNAVLAVVMVYLGDKLGIPIYLAAVIVFGRRIFKNFTIIRRLLVNKTKALNE